MSEVLDKLKEVRVPVEVEGKEEKGEFIVTRSALETINEIKEEKEIPDNFKLRIGIEGAGLSEKNFSLGFDSDTDDKDEVLPVEDTEFVVNKAKKSKIGGIKLDYIDSESASGFKFTKVGDQRPKKKTKATTEKDSDITPEKLEEKVFEALKEVYDPEIPVSIVELGLIYDISVTEKNEVVILMTLTAPNCPVADAIPREVEEKAMEVPEVTKAKAILTFDPPWEMTMMSDEAKLELGFM